MNKTNITTFWKQYGLESLLFMSLKNIKNIDGLNNHLSLISNFNYIFKYLYFNYAGFRDISKLNNK